jgi:multiple sugar transport system permease protein
MYNVYNESFNLSDPYSASAQLVILLVIMIAIVGVQFMLLGTGREGS